MFSHTAILGAMLLSCTVEGRAWSAAAAPGECETYAVQPGDTCWAIMRSTNTTFAQIISWNPDINTQCSNLDTFQGQDICISNPEGNYAIPSNSQGVPTIITTTAPIPSPTPNETEDRCAQFHLVQSGEDCADLTTPYELSMKDFLFLNPHVWENCTNLFLNYHYCVRPVGYISTYPGYLPPTTTSEFVKTPTTQHPVAPDPWWENITGNRTIPIANGTRKDCLEYMYIRNITDTPGLASCWAMAMVYGITPEEFILWNPSLAPGEGGSDQNYAYPCSISESSSYCVALESPTSGPRDDTIIPPTPRAAGEIEGCTSWDRSYEYQTCTDVINSNQLDFATFYLMNPSIRSDCTGLTLGTYYCVSVEEDGGPPTITPTPTTTETTPTGSPTGRPSPTQDGIADTCVDYYLGVAGDECWDIAERHGIALSDFYAWNPAIGTECLNFWPNYYVCVGVSSD